jgi:hypothetical protein
MGFLSGWREWISALLSSASTRVLLIGEPGERICHARGLCQGDPLSPMLFILVMEVHSVLIRAADNHSLLQQVQVCAIPHRVSLYVDDLVVFLRPVSRDLQLLCDIFDLFQGAPGLGYNLSKCQMAPIRCDASHVQLASDFLPCQVVQFPLRYLGMSLSPKKLPKSAWQPLIDRLADKLPLRKGNLMNCSGRLVLIKSTLSAIPLYISIGLGFPAWVQKVLIKNHESISLEWV